jgi:hypothetical protein
MFYVYQANIGQFSLVVAGRIGVGCGIVAERSVVGGGSDERELSPGMVLVELARVPGEE